MLTLALLVVGKVLTHKLKSGIGTAMHLERDDGDFRRGGKKVIHSVV